MSLTPVKYILWVAGGFKPAARMYKSSPPTVRKWAHKDLFADSDEVRKENYDAIFAATGATTDQLTGKVEAVFPADVDVNSKWWNKIK